MGRILVCFVATAASLAPQAAAQKLPQPMPHVAVRVIAHYTGPQRTEQVTVTRAGHRQREDGRRDGAAWSEYSDFARGVSATWSRHDNGDEYLNAFQTTPEAMAPTEGQRTGETQRWAGEVCEVWSLGRSLPGGIRSGALTCLTRDGIELWRGYAGAGGGVVETFHVSSVQRGAISPAEVRLPASALDWSRWRAGATPGDIKSGHEVTLSGSGDEEVGGAEIVIRRRGDWTMTDTIYRGGNHSLDISHARASLHFSDGKGGRRLSLSRHSGPRDSLFGEPVHYTPAREATILGRTCIWYDTMPGWHDVSGSDCRDADGVVLARSATGWGARVTLSVQATSVSLSPPPEEALGPPPDVLSWVRDQDVNR